MPRWTVSISHGPHTLVQMTNFSSSLYLHDQRTSSLEFKLESSLKPLSQVKSMQVFFLNLFFQSPFKLVQYLSSKKIIIRSLLDTLSLGLLALKCHTMDKIISYNLLRSFIYSQPLFHESFYLGNKFNTMCSNSNILLQAISCKTRKTPVCQLFFRNQICWCMKLKFSLIEGLSVTLPSSNLGGWPS